MPQVFRRTVLAQDSIVTAFGTNFTSATAAAETNPAPTTLAGLTVCGRGFCGRGSQCAALLRFSGTIQLPDAGGNGARTRDHQLCRWRGAVSSGSADQICFTRAVRGRRTWPRPTSSRSATARRRYEHASRRRGGSLELVPIDLGPRTSRCSSFFTEPAFAITRVLSRQGSDRCTVEAAFAGPQGTFAGQDQINIELPRTLRGAGVVDVVLSVDGQTTNTVKIHIQ